MSMPLLPNGDPSFPIGALPLAPATRAEGLKRLHAFLPHAGQAYAAGRNYDRGRHDRSGVSVLSPWIRHRLITEEEVVRAVLDRFELSCAEKFVQEVFWRTYWKGWLEMRPEVWDRYRARVRDLVERLDRDPDLAARYRRAVTGRTGIAAFDAWVADLIETGYVHNHARMWFAGIWIYTLELPWELGADFYLRHLPDGDPASNTLSWRWVCGLQTRGKTYLPTAENIAKYTLGRFPPLRGLATEAPPLEEDGMAVSCPSLPDRPAPPPGTRVGLLMTEEDLGVETLPLDGVRVAAVAGMARPDARSPLPVAPSVTAFVDAALRDTLARAERRFGAPERTVAAERLDGADPASAIADWCRRHALRDLVVPETPVGPMRTILDAAEPALAARGIRLFRLRRAWDATAWPHATKGFFPFRGRIPGILRGLGIPA